MCSCEWIVWNVRAWLFHVWNNTRHVHSMHGITWDVSIPHYGKRGPCEHITRFVLPMLCYNAFPRVKKCSYNWAVLYVNTIIRHIILLIMNNIYSDTIGYICTYVAIMIAYLKALFIYTRYKHEGRSSSYCSHKGHYICTLWQRIVFINNQ